MGRKRKRFDSGNQNGSYSDHSNPVGVYDVDCLFEKLFTYSKPPAEEWKKIQTYNPSKKWTCEKLQNLKTDLNNCKAQLNDKSLEEWHEHTTFTNLSGKIINEVKGSIFPEICTQAWCKFYEILCTFMLIDFEVENLNSIHLCEAPGAFVASMNHYLVSRKYKGAWNWLATTLNPYYEGNTLGEMIDDDRFIRESMEKWYFGPDNTGNLMSEDNLDGLCSKASEMGQIMLVTADGSINCQLNPGEQETVVSNLHYCEVLTACKILSPGGSFVLKMFTMFECESVNLVYLLNSAFEVVSVFKPSTSKSGNSEVYLICKNYFGIDNGILDLLCDKYFHSTKLDSSSPEFKSVLCATGHTEQIEAQAPCCLYSREDIPDTFMNQHIECCTFFQNQQANTIQDNLNLFNSISDSDKEDIERMKSIVCDKFIALYELRTIPKNKKITVKNKTSMLVHTISDESKIVTENSKYLLFGTYDDRLEKSRLEWKSIIHGMTLYKMKTVNDITHQIFLQYHITSPPENVTGSWRCLFGKPIMSISSSKFCNGQLIRKMNQILKNCHFFDKVEFQTFRLDFDLFRSIFDEICRSFPNATIAALECSEILLENLQQAFKTESKITNLTESNSSSNMGVLIADARSNSISGVEEVCIQTNLLKLILQSVKLLSQRGSFICWMHTALTRFTAGIIYCLSMFFNRVYLIPSCDETSLSQILVCMDYNGGNMFVIEYLQNVLAQVFTNGDLLEFVPVTVMTKNSAFRRFLTHSNEIILKNFINKAVEMEKECYSQQS